MASVEDVTGCGGLLRALEARVEWMWRGKVQRQADYSLQRDDQVSI